MSAPAAEPAAQRLAPIARWELAGITAVMLAALVATGSRYGYHRDELYFIAAGAHPAWAYPDQPLMAPLLARLADLTDPNSVLVLRIPSILASAVTTVVTGLIAREAGGNRGAQALAAACWAAGAACLATGHIISTATYDICFTAIFSLVLVRLLRTGDDRLWLAAGAVLGVGLLNKSLIGAVVVVFLVALVAVGPREVLRSRWVLAGAGLAILGGLPYGLWQLAHGLPQEQLAKSIAQSGAEGGRGGFIPFQIVLIGPLVAPVWIAGLVALLRNRAWRHLRAFAVTYFALIPILILGGGKAYYMGGMYPVLLGVGAVATEAWVRRGAHGLRTALVAIAVALTATASAFIGLDILPEPDLPGSIVLKLNPDSGETIGWPHFTATVAGVYRLVPEPARRQTAIFTQNYGEAGAIAKLGPALGLPYPHSGHNAWWLWGPPPNRDRTVVVVGLARDRVQASFTGCALKARINDGIGLNNNEQGNPVWLCAGERRPWSQLWVSLRHYD